MDMDAHEQSETGLQLVGEMRKGGKRQLLSPVKQVAFIYHLSCKVLLIVFNSTRSNLVINLQHVLWLQSSHMAIRITTNYVLSVVLIACYASD